MSAISRKSKVLVTTIITCLLLGASVFGAIWVTHTQSAELGNALARCQKRPQLRHQVVISGGKVSPLHTDAHVCDILVITNQDSQERLLAFGEHVHHISYDGVSERIVGRGQNLTVTLVTPGTFIFHDHSDDTVQGTFSVTGTIGRN